MNQMRRAAMVFLAAGVVGVLAAGCQSDQKKSADASPSVMNKTCPVGGEPVEAGKTVAYHGKTVGFCCDSCKGKFEKMTDAQKEAALTKAMATK